MMSLTIKMQASPRACCRKDVMRVRCLPNVPGRESNHHDRRDYQQAHLQPKIIGKAVFVRDLRVHDCDHLLPIGSRRINDPREATRQREKALLPAAPLSRFFGFRHCHPACLAVVSA